MDARKNPAELTSDSGCLTGSQVGDFSVDSDRPDAACLIRPLDYVCSQMVIISIFITDTMDFKEVCFLNWAGNHGIDRA